MGKFIAVMPLAVIAMLAFSLLESTLILPCHMVHTDHRRADARKGLLRRFYHFWMRLPLAVTLGLLALSVAAFLAHLAYPQPLPWKMAGEPWWRMAAAALAYGTLGPAVLVVVLHLVYPLKRIGDLFAWLNGVTARGMEAFIERVYTPVLRWSLGHSALVLSTAAAVLAVSCGWASTMPFNFFPALDSNDIEAKIVYPDGTPSSVTDAATQRLERSIGEVERAYIERTRADRNQRTDAPVELVVLIHRAVGDVVVTEAMGPQVGSAGSHVGNVAVQLVETSKRDVKSTDIVKEWREASGDFPGAESVTFGSPSMGPGGAAIEFKLLAAPHKMEAMERAIEECKSELEKYDCVFDIADDSSPGKWEFQLKVKERAKAMGISLADLAETVRASYYGEEVMRLQRGRHEVKLMVRYPRDQRRSLANFDEIRVRTAPPMMELIRREVERSAGESGSSGGSLERPLTELAEVEVRRGYSLISRQEQLRSITITADVDDTKGNARDIVADLQKSFVPELLAKPEYAGVRVLWEGQQEQTAESVTGLIRGLAVALVVMFALLTLKFRSYFQPVLIMVIIPFGAIGAIVGHWVMGLEITIFSLFGLVALTGVVVNDSIVLIDFINRRVRDGVPLREALVRAGGRRFRPVFLTSITTIGALLPLLLETSFQAQVLIPMATSLCFGLMMTTTLVLLLIPTFYLAYARIAMPETLQTPDTPAVDAPETPVDRDEEVEMFAH
ncbi:MAG: efflux RND transporter permease subunit [Planctomycetes bacterium]|nr:efflux RND transporter permease subunit [Planctomycetota bacterium]